MHGSIARTIARVTRKNQAYLARVLMKYDLTVAEQPFFMALQYREGVTQEELTAMVCVDKAATARAVRSLEEKGFLRREQDESDRRQNRLYPTEQADELAVYVRDELMRFNRLLTKGIDPEALETVQDVLRQMEQNLTEWSETHAG